MYSKRITHISNARFVWIHVMLSFSSFVLIIYDWFAIIDFIRVFTTKINLRLMFKDFVLFIFCSVKFHRVLVFKYIFNTTVKKSII